MIPIECMYVISFIIKTTLVLLYYSSYTDDEIGPKGQVPCSRSRGVKQHRWDPNRSSPLHCSSRPLCHGWYDWAPQKQLSRATRFMPREPGGRCKKQEKVRGGCCWGPSSGSFQNLLSWVGGQDRNDRFGGIQLKVIV